MYAMSYTSQATGHFAQYRDATTKSSKNDILIYRLRDFSFYFRKKITELKKYLGRNILPHTYSNLDYKECLKTMEEGSLVYADPPYAFVHYSRFYHALETLVKYDYPEISHKGRYREDRHQSPFCRATEVKTAFSDMFSLIKKKNANLLLSYSNTGMITLDEIIRIANEILAPDYDISVRDFDYTHSTMGRSDEKSKNVKEYLIVAQKINRQHL
jgi:adenine-specific DNA-methyltransferase